MFSTVKSGEKKELKELSIKQREMLMAYRRDSYERQFPPLPKTPPNTPVPKVGVS